MDAVRVEVQGGSSDNILDAVRLQGYNVTGISLYLQHLKINENNICTPTIDNYNQIFELNYINF